MSAERAIGECQFCGGPDIHQEWERCARFLRQALADAQREVERLRGELATWIGKLQGEQILRRTTEQRAEEALREVERLTRLQEDYEGQLDELQRTKGELVLVRRLNMQSRERAAALEKDLQTWVHRVDDPASMHLHYDGCPFKPWADAYEGDMPEPRPECTCPKLHSAAYWKGQWMLERLKPRPAPRAEGQ